MIVDIPDTCGNYLKNINSNCFYLYKRFASISQIQAIVRAKSMISKKATNNKFINSCVFRELIFASAEAAELPVEVYINRLISDKNFVSPSLSREKITIVKLRVLLFHLEKELEKTQSSLVKIQQFQQKYSLSSSLQVQIQKRLKLVEEMIEKMQRLRLNLNYYLE